MNCQDCRAQVCKAFEFVDGSVPQVIKERPLYCKAGYEASYKAICLKCDIFVQMDCRPDDHKVCAKYKKEVNKKFITRDNPFNNPFAALKEAL
jgi:hypothetical protein